MASKAVDWTKITTKLGLPQATLGELAAFRRRAGDARAALGEAESHATTVDYAKYRSILKNKKVVDEIEAKVKAFKPVSYDTAPLLSALDKFEVDAVAEAKETTTKANAEVETLQKALKDIESARPFDELTAEDIIAVRPEIRETVDTMVKKGRWVVPGYWEKFGNFSAV